MPIDPKAKWELQHPKTPERGAFDWVGDLHEWWYDENDKVCGYAVAGKMIWGYEPPPGKHKFEVIETSSKVTFNKGWK